MGFWDEFGAQALAGLVLAIVAVIAAKFFTDRYAAAREAEQARRERDLAAAADLYQVLGKFFAAWKVWDYHSRRPGLRASLERHSELVAEAAVAEGGCESFIMRMVLEHDLSKTQKEALWCLRFALKELRRAIRDDKPLNWWRSDTHHDDDEDGYREYQAFKGLVPIVVRILTVPSKRSTRRRWWNIRRARQTTQPSEDDRATALKAVTGNGEEFPGTIRFDELEAEEKRKRTNADAQKLPERWVLLAEQLGRIAQPPTTANTVRSTVLMPAAVAAAP
jgi:hypothetical protein